MVGLPQTKGDIKLQNLKGIAPEGQHRIHINALHATGPNRLQQQNLLTVCHLSQVGRVTGMVKS